MPVEVKTEEGLIETTEIMDIWSDHCNGPVTLCFSLMSPDVYKRYFVDLGEVSRFDLQRHVHQVPVCQSE